MKHRLALDPEAAFRLPTLMQAVGFAVWQLQELETHGRCLRHGAAAGDSRGGKGARIRNLCKG